MDKVVSSHLDLKLIDFYCLDESLVNVLTWFD